MVSPGERGEVEEQLPSGSGTMPWVAGETVVSSPVQEAFACECGHSHPLLEHPQSFTGRATLSKVGISCLSFVWLSLGRSSSTSTAVPDLYTGLWMHGGLHTSLEVRSSFYPPRSLFTIDVPCTACPC